MANDENKSIDQVRFTFEKVGIHCEHAREAVEIGYNRLAQIALSGGTDEDMQREFAQTDPLVKAYMFVGFQRQAFDLCQHMLLGFEVLSGVSLFGADKQPVIDTEFQKVYAQMWSTLQSIWFSMVDALEARVNDLHIEHPDGSHSLKPWPYVNTTPQTAPTTTVTLSEQDQVSANSILRSVFGDLGLK